MVPFGPISNFEDLSIPIGRNDTRSDPCQLLCSTYNSTGLGNGFDLCDDPAGSVCHFHTQTCLRIFWSNDSAEQTGFVYETDPVESDSLVPVTCREAKEIVENPSEWHSRNRTIESIINTAITICSETFPLTGFFRPTRMRRLLDRQNSNDLAAALDEFEGRFDAAVQVGATYRHFALPSTDRVRNSLLGIIPNNPNVVSVMTRMIPSPSFGPSPLAVCSLTSQPRVVASLQQLVREAYYRHSCNFFEAQTVLAIQISPPGSIIIPSSLRLGNTLFNMKAVVTRMEDGRPQTIMKVLQPWYSLVGNTVTSANPIRDNTVIQDVEFVFYTMTERIRSVFDQWTRPDRPWHT